MVLSGSLSAQAGGKGNQAEESKEGSVNQNVIQIDTSSNLSQEGGVMQFGPNVLWGSSPLALNNLTKEEKFIATRADAIDKMLSYHANNHKEQVALNLTTGIYIAALGNAFDAFKLADDGTQDHFLKNIPLPLIPGKRLCRIHSIDLLHNLRNMY